jgi:3-dehydroquinate synthase
LRGIRFFQVPTTLLAMVDASVGGKTAIDLPEGKNLVGAFHQPRGVVMDVDFLETLPSREMGCGWAEVIKTAAIRDGALFKRLEAQRVPLTGKDVESLAEVVAASARIKADVVEADEREGGLRRILNFGHTLAHGIETAAGYEGWLHGEAVAVGMVFASELGEVLEVTERGTTQRLRDCLEAYGLPLRAGQASADRLLEVMERDKKKGPGGIRWVLLERVGQATVVDGVERDTVRRELERFLGKRRGGR